MSRNDVARLEHELVVSVLKKIGQGGDESVRGAVDACLEQVGRVGREEWERGLTSSLGHALEEVGDALQGIDMHRELLRAHVLGILEDASLDDRQVSLLLMLRGMLSTVVGAGRERWLRFIAKEASVCGVVLQDGYLLSLLQHCESVEMAISAANRLRVLEQMEAR